MSSHLPADELTRLTPLLASVARLVARGTAVTDGRLRTLLSGGGLAAEPVVIAEMRLWVQLLDEVRGDPSVDSRDTAVEALRLRGLPDAAVFLAVNEVAQPVAAQPEFAPAPPPAARAATALRVTPERLEWTLSPGERANGELLVVGGPGRVETESDQVRVTPTQFGPGETRLRVEVRPLAEGMIWTSVRLVTASATREVPVLAQWQNALPAFAHTEGHPVAPSIYTPPILPSTQSTNLAIATTPGSSSQLILQHRLNNYSLVLWVLSCFIGWCLGVGSISILLTLVANNWGGLLWSGNSVTMTILIIIAGCLGGGSVGLIQWQMLKRFIPIGIEWILVSLVGWVTGLVFSLILGVTSHYIPSGEAEYICGSIYTNRMQLMVISAGEVFPEHRLLIASLIISIITAVLQTRMLSNYINARYLIPVAKLTNISVPIRYLWIIYNLCTIPFCFLLTFVDISQNQRSGLLFSCIDSTHIEFPIPIIQKIEYTIPPMLISAVIYSFLTIMVFNFLIKKGLKTEQPTTI